jgi:siderophore synthetase component
MRAPAGRDALTAERGRTPTRVAATEEGLAVHEPALVARFRDAVTGAASTVAGRLLAAAWRERLLPAASGSTERVPGTGQRVGVSRHAFGRVEPLDPVEADPAALLGWMAGPNHPAVAQELADAAANLALALARRSTMERDLRERAAAGRATDLVDLWADLDGDDRTVAFERLATDGHNLHPCGRTRLGWRLPDLLAHDLESPVTSLSFLAVRRDLHVGDGVAPALLGADYPSDVDPDRYVVTPVHPWQRRHLLGGRLAGLVAEGALRPLDVEVPAQVTAALRTLLVGGGGGDADPAGIRFVKLSLDIQVTSTRRTISVASTRNGPALSRLLPGLIADDRVLLMAEPAGSAVVAPGSDRDLAAIVRRGVSDRLTPDEIAVPASALPARSPLPASDRTIAAGRTVVAELVDRFARTRAICGPSAAALAFVTEYAALLLPPVLRLATRHGIGLEAHLQNCLPTFVQGVPHRLALRDLAGMRVHLPRLGEPLTTELALWPGSVITTTDVDVMRAKVAYTALQAHLSEIVIALRQSHGLDETCAWQAVRSTVDEIYDKLGGEPDLAERARADHTFLTAPTVPHKALLTMRLRSAAGQPGDHYLPVANPLRARMG